MGKREFDTITRSCRFRPPSIESPLLEIRAEMSSRAQSPLLRELPLGTTATARIESPVSETDRGLRGGRITLLHSVRDASHTGQRVLREVRSALGPGDAAWLHFRSPRPFPSPSIPPALASHRPPPAATRSLSSWAWE